MLIAWDNKADAALLTTDSEIATLPGANVQQPHISRKWHTAPGVKSAYLLFDMGSALACALLAVLGTNLTPAATVRVRASTSDPTAVAGDLLDTGVIAAGVKTGYGAIYKAVSLTTARYWRVDLADAAVPDNLQVGRVFLGPSWQPTINMQLGWHIQPLDASDVQESWGGQEFADERPKRRLLNFDIAFIAKTEMFANAFAMARAAGITRSVLGIPDIASAELSEESVYGRLVANEPIVNDRLALYRQRFTIRERL